MFETIREELGTSSATLAEAERKIQNALAKLAEAEELIQKLAKESIALDDENERLLKENKRLAENAKYYEEQSARTYNAFHPFYRRAGGLTHMDSLEYINRQRPY